MGKLFANAYSALEQVAPLERRGIITAASGLILEANGPICPIGSHVTIGTAPGSSGSSQSSSHGAAQAASGFALAQVVGFKSGRILLMPYQEVYGIAPGSIVTAIEGRYEARASNQLLGRIVDAFGEPIDGKPRIVGGVLQPLYRAPPNPFTRRPVREPFDLGVRPLNSLLTMGVGQRMAIMAGSGVGKSTLLGMIAKHATSDVNVIGLVGERGREVREFLERDLGEEGVKRSVLVVATGDQSALMRLRAAHLATAYAEFFRDQGKRVVLMLDSVTRLAMAQREIGLAVGEPPSSKGYTPSVFSVLPRLLERAGNCEGEGSITGIYTVLVEGDDMNEPIADSVRGILDGHIVLSRRLAGRGHFPAIELLESASRVMKDILPDEMNQLASEAREMLATYRDVEDLISIGAYKPGASPKIDRAVKLNEPLNQFLRQQAGEGINFQDSWLALKRALAS